MNTIFCPDCGMIRNKCICSKKEKNQNSLISRPSTEEKESLQQQHPDIDDEIIENFPFKQARHNQLELITEILNAFESDNMLMNLVMLKLREEIISHVWIVVL